MADIRVGTPGVSGPASGALRPSDPTYPQNVSPPEVSLGWYGPLMPPSGLTFSDNGYNGDILYAVPFITQIGGAVSNLGFYNTSAAQTGRNIRTGIYTESAGLPSTLVAEASVTTLTAAAATRTPTISATLSPNTKYFFAMVADGTASIRAASGNAVFFGTAFGNYAHAAGVSPAAGALTRSFTYAALPASWGTPTSIDTNVPIISWKKT
jgi:hypothetical protein